MTTRHTFLVGALVAVLGCTAPSAAGQSSTAQARFRAEPEAEREQARFRAMDTNNDGRITRAEWRGGFDRLDTNQDGMLSGTEIWLPARRGNPGVADPPHVTPAELAEQNPAYRAGYERGLIEGRQAGKEDKTLRNQWDLEGQSELAQADSGYTPQVGLRTDYQTGYRAGFRLGYRQGFGPR